MTPERIDLTDAALAELIRQGCSAGELAAVAQVPECAMQARMDALANTDDATGDMFS